MAAIIFNIETHMRSVSALLFAFTLLACNLASWPVWRCAVPRCAKEVRSSCGLGKACSVPPSRKKHCAQKPGAAAVCCCFGSGCYYLAPVSGFRLRPIERDAVEKPQGAQHRYARLPDAAIWHPPTDRLLRSC